MKRIISLLLLLGFAATYVMAQTTTPDPVLPHATEAPAFDVNATDDNGYDQYRTQTGILLVARNDGSHMQLGYTLYPQPAERDMTLQLQADSPIQPTVYLTDLNGDRTPVKANALTADTRLRMTINARDLDEGMYYLVVMIPGVGETEGMPVIKLDSAPVLIQ